MGKIIAIEGLDACGKETQAKLLYKHFLDLGLNVKLVSFPNYGSAGCSLVEKYLDGGFSESVRESAVCCSSFYTLDRLVEFTESLKDFYSQSNSLLICDRYIGSNAMYQGSKFMYDEDRLKFSNEIYNIETALGIPEEDLCIFLNCDISVIKKNLELREKLDSIEKDLKFLSDAKEVGALLIKTKFRNWKNIECCENNSLKNIDVIHKGILDLCYSNVLDKWRY